MVHRAQQTAQLLLTRLLVQTTQLSAEHAGVPAIVSMAVTRSGWPAPPLACSTGVAARFECRAPRGGRSGNAAAAAMGPVVVPKPHAYPHSSGASSFATTTLSAAASAAAVPASYTVNPFLIPNRQGNHPRAQVVGGAGQLLEGCSSQQPQPAYCPACACATAAGTLALPVARMLPHTPLLLECARAFLRAQASRCGLRSTRYALGCAGACSAAALAARDRADGMEGTRHIIHS